MRNLRNYALWLWLFAAGTVVRGNDGAENIKLNNNLSACLAVDPLGTDAVDNLVILNTQVTVNKSTADCGCFSASAKYVSYLKHNRAKDILQEGQINVLHSGTRKIVLSSDTGFVNNAQVFVDIGCTPPL